MSVEEQLVQLKKRRDALNTQKIETATRLKALEEEKAILLRKCSDMGVDPQSLEQTVQQEEQALQKDLTQYNEDVEKVHAQLRQF